MKAVHPDPETVNGYRLRVTVAAPSSDASPLWRERSEVLTQWLLHEWQRAQREDTSSGEPGRDVIGQVLRGDSPNLN